MFRYNRVFLIEDYVTLSTFGLSVTRFESSALLTQRLAIVTDSPRNRNLFRCYALFNIIIQSVYRLPNGFFARRASRNTECVRWFNSSCFTVDRKTDQTTVTLL